MRVTLLLRFPRRKYMELDYLRHIPPEYMDRMRMHVPRKVYDNRLGAPPINYWKIDPDDYVPQTRYIYDRDVVNETLQRSMEVHKAKLSASFLEKRFHNVKQIPREEWTFFPGDKVQVMVGKDKGRQGTVHVVVHESNCVYVEGMHKKQEYDGFMKRTVEKEQPLFVDKNQVMLVDPTDSEPTTAEWIPNSDGTEYVRISQRSGVQIPIPKSAIRTTEYFTPSSYIEVDNKDTPADVVLKKTYEPKLCTFEEDIMEGLGMEKDRERKPTYWY